MLNPNKLSNEDIYSTFVYSASVSEGVSPPYFVQILSVENKPISRQGIQCNIVSGNYAGVCVVQISYLPIFGKLVYLSFV